MENLEELLQNKSDEHRAKIVYHLVNRGEVSIPKEWLDKTIEYFERKGFLREACFIAEKNNDVKKAIEIYLKNKKYATAAGVAERAGMKDRANKIYLEAIKYSEDEIDDNIPTKENSEHMNYTNFPHEGGLINFLVNFLMNGANRDKVIPKNRPSLPPEAIKRKEELIPGKKYINPRTKELMIFIGDIDDSTFRTKYVGEDSHTDIRYYTDHGIEPYRNSKGEICRWSRNYLIPVVDD